MRKLVLILFLCSGVFSTTMALNRTELPRFERTKLPSQTTAVEITGKINNSEDTTGALRGAGTLPDPGVSGPIGGGLEIVMLCAGVYLFNLKKNRK